MCVACLLRFTKRLYKIIMSELGGNAIKGEGKVSHSPSSPSPDQLSRRHYSLFGVHFAPLQIPFERRLQTSAVLVYLFTFLFLPLVTLFLAILLLFTPFFFLPLLYFAWLFYDVFIAQTSSRGGRRLEWVRGAPVWRHFCAYFPVGLTKTSELSPERNYIIGYHPHGIIGYGAVGNFAMAATGFERLFPGIRPFLMTLKVNFKMPFSRELALALGLCDVTKESIRWILTKQGTGNAVVIVIGGAEEALEARPDAYKLTLLNRKGFVRMALKCGAWLVPVFSFGENDLFLQANNPQGSLLRRIQEKVKDLSGVSPPVIHGRGIFNYTFGFMPFRKPIHTIVGKPIEVPHQEAPEESMVDLVHQRYMDELSRLFDEHKTRYGIDADKKLVFI